MGSNKNDWIVEGKSRLQKNIWLWYIFLCIYVWVCNKRTQKPNTDLDFWGPLRGKYTPEVLFALIYNN